MPDSVVSAAADSAFGPDFRMLVQLLEHAPMAAYVCDAQGRIAYFNAMAEQLWGRAPRLNELSERFCGSFRLWTPQGVPMPHADCWMAQALRTGERVRDQESIVERPDGTRVHGVVHIEPLFDDQQRLLGAVNYVIDVGSRRDAEVAQAKLAAIVESSDDAIVSKSLDGHILTWNQGAERLFGYTAEEAVGRSITFIIPPEKIDEEQHILSKISRGERIEHFETVRVTKYGQRIHVSLTISPVRDRSGQIIGASKVARDITARTQAAEAIVALKDELAMQLVDLRRLQEMSVRLATTLELQAILEETLRTATAVQGTDRGLLSLWNEESESLQVGASLGFDQEFLQRVECVKPGSGACGTAYMNQRRVVVEDVHTDPLYDDYRDAAQKASIRAVHCTPLITRSGKVLGVLSTYFRTNHRPTDREMNLIDLCARQAVDFIENAKLYEQLRDADRRKDEFLATLAHELRNPLAPLCNSLHLLRLSGDLSPTAERVCGIMDRQLTHMVRLIDDLLEVSRITRGKIELRAELVDLTGIIASAVETSRPLIESAGHQLAISLPSSPIMVQVDGVRISQVISNLLNNAAKYTDRGGQIRLSARCENNEVLISIRDNGVGIPSTMLTRVFDMFAQVDQTANRSQGGLGIGLTLARTFVHMHGGRIEARSEGQGQGSEFIVCLPLSSAELALPAALIGDDAEQKSISRRVMVVDDAEQKSISRRVMVVDDAPAAEFILSKLLSIMGHEVQTARSGAEALELARRYRPDVVISDIAMPHMDGYELARLLRLEPGLEQLVLVALTGYGQDSDRQRAIDAGFNYHLVKPISLDSLHQLFHSLPRTATPPPTPVDATQ